MRTRMLRLTFIPLVALIAIAAGTAVNAQSVTSEEVRSSFSGVTIEDVLAAGYVPITPCVDASELPGAALIALNISSSAGMGVHYLNESFLDLVLNPFEPEVFMFGPDGALWGVEYLTPPQANPADLFGEDFHYVAEVDLDALHLWVVDNPGGQFADFNDAVSCSTAVVLQPADTGSGGLDGRSNTSAAFWLAAVAVMLVTLTAVRLRRQED